MDTARLASTITALLIPYLARAGQPPAAAVESPADEPARQLWQRVMARWAGKAGAETAASDLAARPDDSDNQEIFEVQLRKTLKDDPAFADELAGLGAAGQDKAGSPGSGAASGGVAAGAGGIAIGGSVGGHVVMGSGNTVSSTRTGGDVNITAGRDVEVGEIVGRDKTSRTEAGGDVVGGDQSGTPK